MEGVIKTARQVGHATEFVFNSYLRYDAVFLRNRAV